MWVDGKENEGFLEIQYLHFLFYSFFSFGETILATIIVICCHLSSSKNKDVSMVLLYIFACILCSNVYMIVCYTVQYILEYLKNFNKVKENPSRGLVYCWSPQVSFPFRAFPWRLFIFYTCDSSSFTLLSSVRI